MAAAFWPTVFPVIERQAAVAEQLPEDLMPVFASTPASPTPSGVFGFGLPLFVVGRCEVATDPLATGRNGKTT
jgi:hypothetical protein